MKCTTRFITLLSGSLIAAVLLFTPLIAKASTIGTISSWNGSDNMYYFGYNNINSTYGQTILAPATDTQLDSFSFEVKLPSTANFKGYVYAWDTDKMIGSSLFESAVVHTSQDQAFEKITFNTGGINLSPGASYVLFCNINGLSESGYLSGSGYGYFGVTGDLYSGGNFVFANNGNDFNLLFQPSTINGSWNSTVLSYDDLAFDATFSSGGTSPTVPEPATMLLLGLGLVGVAGIRRKLKN
jgi:hypothetical protein